MVVSAATQASEEWRENRRITNRASYRRNAEKNIARASAWNDAHADARRKYRLKKYGLTPESFDALLAQQNGVCALCLRSERRTSKYGNVMDLTVDHDHATGQVRGLLCHSCNVMIGHAADDPALLVKAASYVQNGGI